MALQCNTKEQFIDAKNEYELSVNEKGMLVKDGQNKMMDYSNSK